LETGIKIEIDDAIEVAEKIEIWFEGQCAAALSSGPASEARAIPRTHSI
jgi:hypothetical protein